MEANSFLEEEVKVSERKCVKNRRRVGLVVFFCFFFGTPRFKTSSPATLKKKKKKKLQT